jgi:hypothetical protein
MIRVCINLAYVNGYWIFKSIKAKDPDYLKGLTAFVSGVRDFLTHQQEDSSSATEASIEIRTIRVRA